MRTPQSIIECAIEKIKASTTHQVPFCQANGHGGFDYCVVGAVNACGLDAIGSEQRLNTFASAEFEEGPDVINALYEALPDRYKLPDDGHVDLDQKSWAVQDYNDTMSKRTILALMRRAAGN